MTAAPFYGTPPVTEATQAHRAFFDVVDAEDRVFPLDITAASLSFDQTRAPRVVLNGTAAVPDEPTLAAADPRLLRRVRVHAGYGDDVRLIADLGLRSRTVARPGDTLDVRARSDEAIVLDDDQHFDTLTVTDPSIRDAIKRQVEGAVTPAAWVVEGSDATSTTVDLTDAARWDIIDDLADRDDLDVWDDGLRVWHIAPRVATTSEPHHTMTVGADSTVTDSEAIVSRDENGFANRVQLAYEWTDSADVDHRITAMRQITSGPFTSTLGARRVFHQTREVSTTQAGADAAATALLRRMVTRGRTYRLTGIAAYWLRPGHTVRVSLPTGFPEDHLVEAVDFDLAQGLMTVTLRIPDDTTYTTGGPA